MAKESIQEKAINVIMKQGFSVIILVAAIWWFNGKYQERDLELKECNEARIEVLKTVVRENTKSNYELINYLKSHRNDKE